MNIEIKTKYEPGQKLFLKTEAPLKEFLYLPIEITGINAIHFHKQGEFYVIYNAKVLLSGRILNHCIEESIVSMEDIFSEYVRQEEDHESKTTPEAYIWG